MVDEQRIQYLMFQDEILYNKQKREVRTRRTNTILSLIADVARLTEDGTKKPLNKKWLKVSLGSPDGLKFEILDGRYDFYY